MRVIKNINNNVSLCVDDNGNEAVVFGKGLGFKRPPYEIDDLKMIDKTYYNINANYMKLFNSIPEEIFVLTDQIISYAKRKYGMVLNSNILMTLADHIAFTIERGKKGYSVNYTSFYNIRYLNRDAYEVGVYAVKRIRKSMHVKILEDEEYGIAMHFIDAINHSEDCSGKSNSYHKKITNDALHIVEDFYHIKVDRDSFDYVRFVNHLNFLLTRSKNLDWSDTDNRVMYESFREEFPDIFQCAGQVSELFNRELGWKLNEEEMVYLMLHINRLHASGIAAKDN
ncbi:MAG: PRD domain-containing protein [Clostridiales bacterium]|nr:PRD domain-containing protein [Clostridiales bacterium]